ncbi:MAG: thiol:disulfide interchange protein [Gammaproteobacteria bacterium CG_4_10_14_0_8_um_filter_38_16]|nr:MAG: thiol:disulfide interchange protein [Gammaproteobacteria bacterium CG_4_10_14_0_8_um_filter_38_16]PJA03655.1 MAG: thiol:disulfide interchange protein [Gammaproteobacteria bacterium CG_4_10_14_0_2_um_filter_38_22]PJB11321.1 MAG: thiol:disulfide interchange protein [Gammaproteobacteria bacterium CG_4_9_14_3_um_filter_38_9]
MKYILFCFLLFLSCFSNSYAVETPISANQAFSFSATAKNNQTILLNWEIAPGYYLYLKDFKFIAVKPTTAVLGDPIYPSNTILLNTIEGKLKVYSGRLILPIPIIHIDQKTLVLQAHYQGCSKAGYCYPPITKMIEINLAGHYLKPTLPLNIDIAPITLHTASEKSHFAQLFEAHSVPLLIIGFLGFGILLSLTPCVLPMIPILSSMIVGREHKHAFLLSLFYVFGMSITYAAAGVFFGYVGGNVQIIFQQPWIIICFSILFIIMALSLFGLFQLQLPEKLRSKIATASYHQKGGTYFGAIMMGILSTLILSPCVTPPLVAAFGFISQTGNAILGGTALFAMGVGMGAPLLLIGALGTRVLPKSGAWMNAIKIAMGFILLAIAINMLQRILSEFAVLILWATLPLGAAIYLGAFATAKTPWMIIKKVIGIILFIASITLIVKAVLPTTQKKSALVFQPVHSVSQINTALIKAEKNNQPVLLDFYANWCIDCKELDALTFHNPAVQAKLSHFVLLRVDLTNNSANDQALMKKYNVIAPPTILFFKNGRELTAQRLIGFLPAKPFLKKISQIQVSD